MIKYKTEEEIAIMKCKPVNDSKEANKDNKNVGYKISFAFHKDDKNYQRWMKKYNNRNISAFID